MSSHLTRFNNQIEALVNALKSIESIKNDPNIQTFELKYNIVRNADSKKPLECFIKYVYPLKDKIMKKDEAFFLGGNINEKIQGVNTVLDKDNDPIVNMVKENDEFILHQALNIKNHWENSLTNEQRNIIWTYFQVLIKLSEKYIMEKVNVNNL